MSTDPNAIRSFQPASFGVLPDETDEGSTSTVVISYVHPNQGVVLEKFNFSMAQQCANMGKRVIAITSHTSPSQTHARNSAIKTVLDMDPVPDWLLWWDTDMSLPENALRDIIDIAELNGAKIATCFGVMQRHGHRESQPWTPVANAFFAGDEGQMTLIDFLPRHDVPIWCDATGMGFTLVHMSVFQNFPKDLLPWHKNSDELTDDPGHDVRFCLESGEKVLYCTNIRSQHWKLMPLDYGMYLRANQVNSDEDQAYMEKLSSDWFTEGRPSRPSNPDNFDNG